MRRSRISMLLAALLFAWPATSAVADDEHSVVVYTVLFDRQSAALSADDQAVLGLLADLMKGKEAYRVRIAAFTDPVDEDEDDEELAEARGKAVRDHLVARGTEADHLEIEAKGDEKSFGRDESESDRALRRRVEVAVREEDVAKRAVDSDLGDDLETRLQTTVFFDFDEAEVRPEFRATLARLGRMLRDSPTYVARVFGHTDGIGDPAYNQKLGERRCAAVAAVLREAGASDGALVRVSLGEGETVGAQEWRATTSRALSRSVEIKVLSAEADDEGSSGRQP